MPEVPTLRLRVAIGALMRCLEDHADDEDTPKLCHDAIGRNTQQKNKDFRLNPLLQKTCEADINEFCAEYGVPKKINQGLIKKAKAVGSDLGFLS